MIKLTFLKILHGASSLKHMYISLNLIMAQLKLNLTKDVSSMYLILHTFILQVYMHECAMKITDVEALTKSTHVHTRCVHDNFHEHVRMLGTYTPNLVLIHLDMYVHKSQG